MFWFAFNLNFSNFKLNVLEITKIGYDFIYKASKSLRYVFYFIIINRYINTQLKVTLFILIEDKYNKCFRFTV